MNALISGIQQAGIGVRDAEEAAKYYKEIFGFDCLVFDDTAEASLMRKYTGGKVYRRRAMLTMNMQGGGGLELWQFTDREAVAARHSVSPTDLGIVRIKIKTSSIEKASAFFQERLTEIVSPVTANLFEQRSFLLRDQYGNDFEVVESRDFFSTTGHVCGGVAGATIQVSNLDRAQIFYSNLLQNASIIYPHNNGQTPGRQLLRKNKSDAGAFADLLGGFDIELVQALPGGTKVYEDRYWGDLGFMHLCLDVLDMDAYKKILFEENYLFSVDSAGFFEMDIAGGRFCYIEDEDGTLIELVETYKVPVVKKLGLYLNLKKRKSKRPLPKWMVKLLGLSKVK